MGRLLQALEREGETSIQSTPELKEKLLLLIILNTAILHNLRVKLDGSATHECKSSYIFVHTYALLFTLIVVGFHETGHTNNNQLNEHQGEF